MVRGYVALAAAVALLFMGAAASGSAQDHAFAAPAVQGHATFVTLEIAPRAPQPVAGLAVCERAVELPGLLESIVDALDSCREDLEAVYATPLGSPDPAQQTLTPTGRERTHVDGNGVEWTTVEYVFPLPSGAQGVTYVVAVGPRLTHPDTGEEYNFVLAQPPPPRGADGVALVLSGGLSPL